MFLVNMNLWGGRVGGHYSTHYRNEHYKCQLRVIKILGWKDRKTSFTHSIFVH